MVEIEGERALAPSCLRTPTPDIKVSAESVRARTARRMVMELLLADQPARDVAHDGVSKFWHWADAMEVTASRFPACRLPETDASHPAMTVNLDACIHCTFASAPAARSRSTTSSAWPGGARNPRSSSISTTPWATAPASPAANACRACPTGALMETTLLDERGVGLTDDFEEVHSVCPYCGVGCQMTYRIADNKIAAVDGRAGPSNLNRLCVKGRFGFDYVTHPQRLLVPLIRRDDAPKATDHGIDPARPESHFREATWEEALARASAGLKTIVERDGGKAMAGFGSAKGSNEEAYMFQKLVRTGFRTNTVDHCTRLCHASSVAALMETIGSAAVTAPFMAASDSDVIIVIGANPTENHPVAATFFKNAAKAGKTLIVMDPRGQALSRHATHMLQFRPGTDVALLNALINVIIEEGLYDTQYVAAHTEGFEALAEHIKPFTPEVMEGVCGIAADTLRSVAREYAGAKAGIIFWGMGISQSTHGTDNARCLISLALITGQVGRPGTGLHPLRGQNNVQGASDAGLIPMVFPDYQSVEDADIRARFEDFWGTKLDPEKGLTVVEIMDAVHAGRIKGMYIMGENPAMSDPDAGHAREALAMLEHLVVQDIFLTETACFADVVLPASAWPEKDGTVTNTNRQVQMGRKALDMPGDARQDWWIIQEIARGIGLDWNYGHPRDVFAEMAAVMPSLANISWQRVERENSVTYPCVAPDRTGSDIVFGDGFPTPSTRGKMVPADIIPPDEMPDDEYPMILTTGTQLEHWHTGAMSRRSRVLDAIEPDAVASVNPDDLGGIGAEPGDMIRIMTRRGAIEMKARADAAVPRGVVFIAFCFVEAAANLLTNAALDPIGKIPDFKFCAARVEKAERTAAAE